MNTRIHSAAFWLAVSASLLCGQTSANAPGSSAQPLPVKRIPAGKVSPQIQNASPLPVQNYDFGGQLRVLQDPTALNQGPPRLVPRSPPPLILTEGSRKTISRARMSP